MTSLLELFCAVDDFCQTYEPQWRQLQLTSGVRQRNRTGQLSPSEIMTLLILFHQSHYRHFKAFYCEHVQSHLRAEFPGLVSYTRFVELIPTVVMPLAAYARHCQGQCTGISFVDATALAVCANHRIPAHRVFAGLARRGKTSLGWFYGFKLHLVVNDCGDLVAFALTPGNVDDRQVVPQFAKQLFGKLFGDRGYVSQPLVKALLENFRLHLITPIKAKMKNRLMLETDKLLLRKRAIIETVIDQLKNISQIEHARHRSPINFVVNVLCGLIAYCHQPKKPSLQLEHLPVLGIA